MFGGFSAKAQKIKQRSQQAQVQEILQIRKWNQGIKASGPQTKHKRILSLPVHVAVPETLRHCSDARTAAPLPPNFHFFLPCRTGWIWSGPIGVWIMKGLPGAGRGPVIPRTGGVGFWVGFGWVSLLRDACTHVSLWQPLPKSEARPRRCMYYIGKHCRTRHHLIGAAGARFYIHVGPGHIALYEFLRY